MFMCLCEVGGTARCASAQSQKCKHAAKLKVDGLWHCVPQHCKHDHTLILFILPPRMFVQTICGVRVACRAVAT